MSFARKCIDVELTLKANTFAGGSNSIYLTGLRVSAHITQPGAPDFGQLQAAIYGLSLSKMNALTTLGRQYSLRDANTIRLYAYEEGQKPSLVFAGTILDGYPDMRGAPQVAFRVAAHAGMAGAVAKVAPTTMQGAVKAETLLKQICQKGGWQFENNGVDALLRNPYLPGGAYRQAVAVMHASRCLMTVDRDTLAVWKPGGSRQGSVPLISPGTGMIGYPRYRQAAVEVETAYLPTVQMGGRIQVQSELTPACGVWAITYVEHELEAELPGGKWQTTIQTGAADVQQ
ncbi:hypothetical protein ABC766_32140 (plasmid) [Methylobacterium fujisawaense]|uniref:baseplate hub protein n=1 Tax=Methylobacterium fujisawaense TaxID=107400 RepID=UPI0031F4A58A